MGDAIWHLGTGSNIIALTETIMNSKIVRQDILYKWPGNEKCTFNSYVSVYSTYVLDIN